MYNTKRGCFYKEKPLLFYFNRVYWNQTYQKNFFDDIPFGVSNSKLITKKIRLLHLMLAGSGNWYRKIDKYQKLLCDLNEKRIYADSLLEIWDTLQEVIKVFCEYIGKDHYRFLGLAQVGYNLLSIQLKDMENRKEVIAGLIESGASKNMTMESNYELFCLSQYAKSLPEIYKVFLICPVQEIYRELLNLQTSEAEKFIKKFDDFIQRHGHRGTSCDDLYSPHWVERPEIVLELIKQFLLNPSDNLKQFSKCTKVVKKNYKVYKRKVFSHISATYKGMPNRVWRMAKVLFFSNVSSRYMALRENQRYYFDKSWLLIRRLLIDIGKKFVEYGLFFNEEDIFHLTIDEITGLVQNSELRKQKNWTKIIESRIRTYKKNARITPPYLIKNDSIYRIHGKINKNSFKAVGISSGTAVGRVHIILNIKDLSEVKDGEIAVVSTFHPSWTPILGIVSGLVMNYGNILSHGAVIAREYRIPVVIFNDTATTVFKNGQMIEINGDTGRIRVVGTETKT